MNEGDEGGGGEGIEVRVEDARLEALYSRTAQR